MTVNKKQLLKELKAASDAAEDMEFSLRVRGEDAKAEATAQQRRRLIDQREKLLAKIMVEWPESVKDLGEEIAATNLELKEVVKEIKKNVKMAENVVKAAGKLDKIIEKATEFVAKL
jgi:hypothetical protein